MKEVFIVAARRTPIGGLMGSLSAFTAPQLGALAIKGTYEAAGFEPDWIDSVYMGNVLSAGLGQSPARQAARFAGIPDDKDASTINKVCASGMKATMLAAQQIQLGLEQAVISGGMESMSNTPHYAWLRKPVKYGNAQLVDGMIHDGLWDAYHHFHMGNAAEMGIRKYGLSREMLDEFAISSYSKAKAAAGMGKLAMEILPVELKMKSGTAWMNRDEDIDKIILDKVSKLKPTFEESGALTAANSSNLNDGAAALLLVSEEMLVRHQLKPLASIVAYADAAQAPEWFTTSPSVAIPKALKRASLELKDIDFWEINEAYASVVLSNQQLLGLDPAKVNIYGGAVAMGHPIGASGARIIVTLLSVLKQEGGKYGVAAICNGGGGASAIVLKNY